MTGLLAVFAVADPERLCRLRELRVAALLLLGAKHPLLQAVDDAIKNPEVLDGTVDELDKLPAIPRRRVLAVMAQVLR